jgi:fluoride exporter
MTFAASLCHDSGKITHLLITGLIPCYNFLLSLLVALLAPYCVLLCLTAFINYSVVAAEWRAGLLVGVLGAFTTFSTFSLETFTLMENGAFLKAGLNVFLSVVLCLAATWLGIGLGRQL